MKTTTKKIDAFAHANDLAPAYREFSAAIAALVELQENGPVPFRAEDAKRVTELSETSIARAAADQVAAWQRVGAAACRVHRAICGPKAPVPERRAA